MRLTCSHQRKKPRPLVDFAVVVDTLSCATSEAVRLGGYAWGDLDSVDAARVSSCAVYADGTVDSIAGGRSHGGWRAGHRWVVLDMSIAMTPCESVPPLVEPMADDPIAITPWLTAISRWGVSADRWLSVVSIGAALCMSIAITPWCGIAARITLCRATASEAWPSEAWHVM